MLAKVVLFLFVATVDEPSQEPDLKIPELGRPGYGVIVEFSSPDFFSSCSALQGLSGSGLWLELIGASIQEHNMANTRWFLSRSLDL